jgi:hypothetical protein
MAVRTGKAAQAPASTADGSANAALTKVLAGKNAAASIAPKADVRNAFREMR